MTLQKNYALLINKGTNKHDIKPGLRFTLEKIEKCSLKATMFTCHQPCNLHSH